MVVKEKLPSGYYKDNLGNVRSMTISEVKDGKLYISYNYILEQGATTLRGEHPKLSSKNCVFSDRLSCNYCDGIPRCEYMKYANGRWVCISE